MHTRSAISALVVTAYVVVASPGSTAAPAPAQRGDNACGIADFYGEYPGTLGNAAIYTKAGSCKDKIVLRCDGGQLVLDYTGSGPDVEGMLPDESEPIACGDVTDVFVTTKGGADVVDLRQLTDGQFPAIGSIHAAGDEPVEVMGGGGADKVFGSDFPDLVSGGDGGDALRGFDADDEMYGNAGDDLVSGGLGEDVLKGGTGRDCILQEPNTACAFG